MGSVATCLADELGPRLPIGLMAMTALDTSTTGVAGIDRHDGYPGQFRLIRQKAIKLSKRPSREPIASVGALSRDPLADALEGFEGDTATGAFSLVDDRPGDAMVLV